MPAFFALLVTAVWMFSFCLIAASSLIAASNSINPEAVKYVGITLVLNVISYTVLMNYYLKLKYLCDKFIEE